jgi:hypothetical protein
MAADLPKDGMSCFRRRCSSSQRTEPSYLLLLLLDPLRGLFLGGSALATRRAIEPTVGRCDSTSLTRVRPLRLVRIAISPLPAVNRAVKEVSFTPLVEVYSNRAPRGLLARSVYTRRCFWVNHISGISIRKRSNVSRVR